MDDSFPRKIYVELTTRCNLQCRMCVKYTEGGCIVEGDLPLELFGNIVPVLPQVGTLILNGIGEPLMHPELDRLVVMARGVMRPEAVIGFQSNGLLLSEPRAEQLLAAGLSTICLSMDGFEPDQTLPPREDEHNFAAVARAVAALQRARAAGYPGFRIGIETVLSTDNIGLLPQMVRWAADNGIEYLLATHLLLYDGGSERLSLFNPNSEAAVEIYRSYAGRAAAQGIRMEDCLGAYRKFGKTAKDYAAMELLAAMQQEADAQDIRLHLPNLIAFDQRKCEKVDQAYAEARRIADCTGLQLELPPLEARSDRSCPFLNEQATFVAANGDVLPCHFLWHGYSCRVNGESIQVRPRPFGNLQQDSLARIWDSEAYRQFRKEAGQYQYAPCWNCAQGPCPTLINDRGDYANDCFGSRVPCGHCQWNLGGVRCL